MRAVGDAVAVIASALRPEPRPPSRAPVVLVDGRSGAGKSGLALLVAAEVPGVSIIRLDDVYPGWDGLDAGSTQILEGVLEPLSAGRPARWRRWDWHADASAEWNTVDPDSPVLIEGAGALSRANRLRADLGVWVELDDRSRRRRALERDGDGFAEHWDRWAEQETAFIAREEPDRAADLVVDGRTMAR